MKMRRFERFQIYIIAWGKAVGLGELVFLVFFRAIKRIHRLNKKINALVTNPFCD